MAVGTVQFSASWRLRARWLSRDGVHSTPYESGGHLRLIIGCQLRVGNPCESVKSVSNNSSWLICVNLRNLRVNMILRANDDSPLRGFLLTFLPSYLLTFGRQLSVPSVFSVAKILQGGFVGGSEKRWGWGGRGRSRDVATVAGVDFGDGAG